MNTKTIMLFHLTQPERLRSRKQLANSGENVRKEKPLFAVGVIANWVSTIEVIVKNSQKAKIRSTT